MMMFMPEFKIQASERNGGQDVAYRVSAYFGDQFLNEGGVATIVTGADDDLRLSATISDSSGSVLEIILVSGDRRIHLGRITLDKDTNAEDQKSILGALQREFFRAVSALPERPVIEPLQRAPDTAYVSPPVTLPVKAPRKVRPMWIVVALAVALGGSIAAYGQMRHKTDVDEAAAGAVSTNPAFASIQRQIEDQMRNSGGSSNTALAGQNVAISTMRAMGLEPGKANTGCLVGVR